MGAMLTHVVQLLAYAEQNSLTPVCRISNPLYADGPDVFSKYFEMRPEGAPADRELLFHTIKTAEDYTLFKPAAEPTLNEMNRVFHKYIGFSRRVSDAVERFLLDVPRYPKLGIHYRGTDKISEAPEVGYQEVFTAVEEYLKTLDTDLIFLATDSNNFSQAVRREFSKINFISFDSETNMDIDGPRHFSGLSSDEKAMEAIANMVLLSRCEVCIRTASQLSVWGRILNKNLRTVTLNRPFISAAYPENLVWDEMETLRPSP